MMKICNLSDGEQLFSPTSEEEHSSIGNIETLSFCGKVYISNTY